MNIEHIVLASPLADYKCTQLIVDSLTEDDFYDQSTKDLFSVYKYLFESQKKIDLITTSQELIKRKSSVDISYLINITNLVASASHIDAHIEALINQSIKKKITLTGHKLISDSLDESIDGRASLLEAINEFQAMYDRTTINVEKSFKEHFIDVVDEIFRNDGSESLGLLTGFAKFDKMTSGLCAPDLTILAAGPGEGKSTFALNLARNISIKYGTVAYFSLEMKTQQLIWKLISAELGTSVQNVRMGHIPNDYVFKSDLTKSKLKVYDKGGISIDELCAICRMEKNKNDLQMIVIDYIQLITLKNYIRKVSSKTDEVTIISNKLKQLAMDLNVPILGLSQLNRDKNRKRYTLADIRDSGSIEQDADNVIFIFRPTIHNMQSYEFGPGDVLPCDDETTIINIEKGRLMRTGEFEMAFKGEFSRFEDLCQQPENGHPGSAPRPNKNNIIPF